MVKKTVWLVMLLLLAATTCAEGQQRKVPRIGLLSFASSSANSSRVEAFEQGLHELGYTLGSNIAIEYRYADGKEDRLPALVADLVRLRVDIIVAGGGNATLAAKNATKTIPIIISGASDPVGTGLVASLARPGGNITGLTGISPDLSGKRLELLKEVIPGVSRVAVLLYRDNSVATLLLKETEAAAQPLGLQLQILQVNDSSELQNVFETIKKGRSEAIDILSSAFFSAWRKEIVELAARVRLPAMYVDSTFIDAGGLMSYGANIPDMYRHAATFVDKILKGRKPADLPVEQPTKFEFIVNLKAANQIGLTIPPNVLARADKVIK